MKPFLIRRAIVVAMRKPADCIPLSNMTKVRQRDYFAIYLCMKGDRQRFVVTEILA
ncbi:hypothetical protein ABIA15_002088 [Sinorhizobium fredii]